MGLAHWDTVVCVASELPHLRSDQCTLPTRDEVLLDLRPSPE